MANLFDKVKETGATAATKGKVEKLQVIVTDPQFHLSLSRLAEVNAEIDALSAESMVLGSEVKEVAKREYKKLYDSTLKHPGSFIIKAEVPTPKGSEPLKTASLMFITTDRYITINEERANELKNCYGNEIVSEKTTYIMDSELVEKYGEVISGLIEKCKNIPDTDKEKLISAVVKFEVKKGTISDLKTKYSSFSINEILEDIKPVYQMKAIRIEE